MLCMHTSTYHEYSYTHTPLDNDAFSFGDAQISNLSDITFTYHCSCFSDTKEAVKYRLAVIFNVFVTM